MKKVKKDLIKLIKTWLPMIIDDDEQEDGCIEYLADDILALFKEQ